MRAEPERDVPVVGARHVEAFGILEGPRVAVGRGVQQEQLVALVELLTVELVVVGDGPAHVEHRRDPADELLDRGRRQQLGALDEQSPLVGLERELADHRADHRAGRLGAAVEDEDRLLEDVAGVPALGCGPDRDEVVTRLGAPRLDDRAR